MIDRSRVPQTHNRVELVSVQTKLHASRFGAGLRLQGSKQLAQLEFAKCTGSSSI